jgi:hypothetical protein
MPKISPNTFLRIADRMAAQYQLLRDLEAVIAPTPTYQTLTLEDNNPDVITTITEAAQDLDRGATAPNFAAVVPFHNLIYALCKHLTRYDQRDLINGYLRENDLRVHENFNTLFHYAFDYSLWAAYVFSSTPTLVAQITLIPGPEAILTDSQLLGTGQGEAQPLNYAAQRLQVTVHPRDDLNLTRTTTLRLTLIDQNLLSQSLNTTYEADTAPGTTFALPNRSASLTLGSAELFNTLTLTANTPGPIGNDTTLEIIQPNTPNTPLAITTNGPAIQITLATDPNGQSTSTAGEIRDSINLHPDASTLVTATTVGPSYGYIPPLPVTQLTGGDDTGRYYGVTAVELLDGGEAGDQYTISNTIERPISL